MTTGSNVLPFGLADRIGERLGGRGVDQHPGFTGDDRFERAAARERNHRTPAGLRLERHNTEVLLAGHQRECGTPIQVAKVLVRQPAEKLDLDHGARCSRRARSGPVPTILSGIRREPARLDGDIEALVGDQRRHDQGESLGNGGVGVEELGIDGRIHHKSPRDYSIGGSCPQHAVSS